MIYSDNWVGRKMKLLTYLFGQFRFSHAQGKMPHSSSTSEQWEVLSWFQWGRVRPSFGTAPGLIRSTTAPGRSRSSIASGWIPRPRHKIKCLRRKMVTLLPGDSKWRGNYETDRLLNAVWKLRIFTKLISNWRRE